ncbi:preprotein translocase subunit SecG [Flavonifractor plautii]|nr:preprotein translocase subunit SecG [Flavonifractor plautii]
MSIPQLILSIVDVAAAIFLIAVVLLQSGKSAGLSGAIAVADTFMAKNRAKTWDAKLAKLTKWVAIGFVVITFVMCLL